MIKCIMQRRLIKALQLQQLTIARVHRLAELYGGPDRTMEIARCCRNYARLERLRRGKNPWRQMS